MKKKFPIGNFERGAGLSAVRNVAYFYINVLFIYRESLSDGVWVVGMATAQGPHISNNQHKTLLLERPSLPAIQFTTKRMTDDRRVQVIYNGHGHFAKQLAGPPDNDKSPTRERKALAALKMLEPAIIKTKVAPQFGGPAPEGCLCHISCRGICLWKNPNLSCLF